MSAELADDLAVRLAMEQDMLDHVKLSRIPRPDIYHEPWGGHFSKRPPQLALNPSAEA